MTKAASSARKGSSSSWIFSSLTGKAASASYCQVPSLWKARSSASYSQVRESTVSGSISRTVSPLLRISSCCSSCFTTAKAAMQTTASTPSST